jgi:MerR family transcriptional regulator, copper efflux regulator
MNAEPGARTATRLTIGELAKHARVNRETVRYYERRRLLARPVRSLSGYRMFNEDALRRLRFIRHAKLLGFSLREIKELLALRIDSADTCERVCRRTELKLADIENRIAALERMRRALRELVAACSRRGKSTACPILDSLEASADVL